MIIDTGRIPKIIIDDALRYYTSISQAKTFRGLNRDGILAASIYIACSINKHPRTAKEIAQIFSLDNTNDVQNKLVRRMTVEDRRNNIREKRKASVAPMVLAKETSMVPTSKPNNVPPSKVRRAAPGKESAVDKI